MITLKDKPVRQKFLPYFLPDIGEEEIRAVVEALESGWLTSGPRVAAFERAFADYVGAKHAIATNSGTAALHLALEAVGLKAGDEVLVPTMTFAATAEVVHYFGARPVLVDCHPGTLNLDPRQLETKITDKTRAVIPVHFGGQPCEMDTILDIARAHGLAVIEDAAHALPAAWNGVPVGCIGDLTCFSFYANKTITTGEGGMVTTNHPQWAERIRTMRLHGIEYDAWSRHTENNTWYYEIHSPGFKYNMTDVAAALGFEQLKKCDRFLARRRWIAERYTHGLADLAEVQPVEVLPLAKPSWHLFVIRVDFDGLTLDRNEFIRRLHRANIAAGVHFMPLHLHPYYRDGLGYRAEDFPVATSVFERVLSLPIYPKMEDADVQDVIDAVRRIIVAHRIS